jgi:hypothetical protein
MYGVKLVDTSGRRTDNILKHRINDFESDNKNKNMGNLYRDINAFKRDYQPRTNLIKTTGIIYLLIFIKL